MAQQMIGDVMKKGEEIFQNVSGKLMEQPAVQKAVEAAMAGKDKVDEGMAMALKTMNVQPRAEFRGLKKKVEALEAQVAELRAKVDALRGGPKSAAKPKAGARKAGRKA